MLSIGDDLGGVRQALDNLGIEVTLFAIADIGPAARRIVTAAWPDVTEFGMMEDVDEAMLRRWLEKGPHVDVVFVSGCLKGGSASHTARQMDFRAPTSPAIGDSTPLRGDDGDSNARYGRLIMQHTGRRCGIGMLRWLLRQFPEPTLLG